MHISRLCKAEKVDIENILSQKPESFSAKTLSHIHKMHENFGYNEIFGRSAIATLLNLQNSSTSKLIAKLLQAGIIEPVSGHGKSKYKFSKSSNRNP